MNVKNGNKLAIVTVTAIAAMFVSQPRAEFRAGADDGIAASPRLRQRLDERKAAAGSVGRAGVHAGYRATGADECDSVLTSMAV